MAKSISEITREVQGYDEGSKRFWALVLSAISMVAVLGLWGLYGYLFGSRSEQLIARSSERTDQTESSNQLASVSESVRGVIEEFRGVAATRRNLRIDAEDRNFIYDDLEPIPITSLP
jgi:hypothetical protein